MLTSIDVKFIFDSARLGLFSSPNILQISRCSPLSCVHAVLAMLLAIISPSSYSWNEWNVSHFKTTEPRPQVFSVNGALTCKKVHFWRHRFIKRKILPHLVIRSWLWWILRVLLANQNRGKYFEWIIRVFNYNTLCLLPRMMDAKSEKIKIKHLCL